MITDNVLYIIGNGFDLHHGVQSSYGNFEQWLKVHNQLLHSSLEDVCNVDFLCKQFEHALGYVNRDYFIACGEIMLPETWSEDDGYAPLFYAGDYVREEAERLWNEINKWFRKWVKTLKWQDSGDTRKIRLDTYARFITFNYTPFLETRYGIPAENILYIHGKTGCSPKPPLIGHDPNDTFDQWYQSTSKKNRRHYRGKRCMLPEVEMMTSNVETYFSLSEKPVNEIIKKHDSFLADLYDIEHIYILGHSLGLADLPYFKAIKDTVNQPEKLTWKISYHTDKEMSELEQTFLQNIDPSPHSLSMIKMTEYLRLQKP